MAFLQTIIKSTTLRTTTPILRHTSPLLQTIPVRHYRGESGEMTPRSSTPAVEKREQELLAVAVPRAQKIYDEHTSMPSLSSIPAASLPPDMDTSSSSTKELELEVRKKRLVYRAKQRGWLEVDILLGTWASTYVPTLSAEELDEFEDFVNMETIDIYNVVTLRLDVPEECVTEDGSGVVERIQEWARGSPLGKGPEGYEKVKKEHNLI